MFSYFLLCLLDERGRLEIGRVYDCQEDKFMLCFLLSVLLCIDCCSPVGLKVRMVKGCIAILCSSMRFCFPYDWL